MAATLKPEPYTWSRIYGGEKKRTYRGKYGRVTTYDEPLKFEHQDDYTKSIARHERRSRYDRHVVSPCRSSSPYRARPRVSMSMDRNHTYKGIPSSFSHTIEKQERKIRYEHSPTRGRSTYVSRYDHSPSRGPSASRTRVRTAESVDREMRHQNAEEILHQVDRSYHSSYGGDVDKENKSRFLKKPKYYTKSMSVDRDIMRDIHQEINTSRKSRFLDPYNKATIKRKVAEVYDREFTAIEPSVKEPKRTLVDRSKSYEGLDFRTLLDGVPRRHRATSTTPYEDLCVEKVLAFDRNKRPISRSRSVSRYHDVEVDMRDRELAPKGHYRSRAEALTDRDIMDFPRRRGSDDISSYVIDSKSKFEPDDIRVTVLPSGKKAVTYSQFSQHTQGDKREANAALDHVIEKTRFMQQSMTTLEDFVRRNRSMFPEETRIYQQVRFFQLTEAQLLEIGENPDAEVYGVKIREQLVVPHGTDVAYLLQRYYGKTEVEVQYQVKQQRRQQAAQEIDSTYAHMVDDIHQQVSREYEIREKSRVLGKETYQVKQATKDRTRRDDYNHIHPHLSSNYIRSIYTNAGLAYDDIYTPRRTSYASSVTSDQESTRSSLSSRRRKRFDSAPSFTAKLRGKKCLAGQTVRFNCSVSGLPMPHVTWMRGNRIIQEGGRFVISNNYGLLSLEIQNVHQEDVGLYTVQLTNVEGEVACSASLEVQDVDYGRMGQEGPRKPHFTMEALNTWAEQGNKATIEAQALGRPMPTFKWLKDNIALVDDGRITTYSDERGNAKVVIKDVKDLDAGLYFCIADNKAGKAKCAATLRVVTTGQLTDQRRRSRSKSRETTPIGTQYSDLATRLELATPPMRGQKPYFIQTPPAEIHIREGDPLTLKCVVDGDPKPYVTWQKGVRELQYTQRHRVLQEGDHYMMQIASTLMTDIGQFIAIIQNPLGKTQTSCWVNIVPRDSVDGDEWHMKTYHLEMPESEIETIRTEEVENVPPRFVKRLPLEIMEDEGDNLSLQCRVKDAEPHVYTKVEHKLKRKGEFKLEEKTLKLSTKPGEEKVTVVDKHYIPLGAETGTTTATPAEQEIDVVIETPVEAKKEPAQDVLKEAPVEDTKTEVVQEEVVEPVLKEVKKEVAEEPVEPASTAPAESAPKEEPQADIPKVMIQPAEEEKPQEGGEEIEVEKTPEVHASKPSEPVDEKEEKPVEEEAIQAEVKEKVKAEVTEAVDQAPELEAELQDLMTKVKDVARIVLKVKFTKPEPDVKWFKDGKRLEESDRYHMTGSPGQYALEICNLETSDAGMYSCSLVNDLGMATSTCQLKVTASESDSE